MKLKKYCIIYGILLVVTVIFVLGSYLCFRVCKKMQNQENQIILLTNEKSYLAEMLVLQRTSKMDSFPHNVLCIGNSITLHTPSDKINWYSSHGMAASKPDFDYCHRLEQMLKEYNPASTVTPINIATWERNFSTNLDSLLKGCCENKDIIIIRLGENVAENIHDFQNALSHLIQYCKQYADRIIITGMFWENSYKEYALIENSKRYDIKFVPISWIWNLYCDECTPNEGDSLINIDGLPYCIEGDFILTHPNDKGMELIAISIFNSLEL